MFLGLIYLLYLSHNLLCRQLAVVMYYIENTKTKKIKFIPKILKIFSTLLSNYFVQEFEQKNI